MTFLLRVCVLGCIAGSLSVSPARGAAKHETGCIGDWSVAAGIVAAESLTPVEELSPLVGEALNGAIVRALLCREDGKYVYQIVVRDRHGQFSKHKIDARRPAARETEDAP